MPSVQLFMAAAFYLHGEHPDIFCAVCCLSVWNFVYDFWVFFFSYSFLFSLFFFVVVIVVRDYHRLPKEK